MLPRTFVSAAWIALIAAQLSLVAGLRGSNPVWICGTLVAVAALLSSKLSADALLDGVCKRRFCSARHGAYSP
jgi:hypothetical protein